MPRGARTSPARVPPCLRARGMMFRAGRRYPETRDTYPGARQTSPGCQERSPAARAILPAVAPLERGPRPARHSAPASWPCRSGARVIGVRPQPRPPWAPRQGVETNMRGVARVTLPPKNPQKSMVQGALRGGVGTFSWRPWGPGLRSKRVRSCSSSLGSHLREAVACSRGNAPTSSWSVVTSQRVCRSDFSLKH